MARLCGLAFPSLRKGTLVLISDTLLLSPKSLRTGRAPTHSYSHDVCRESNRYSLPADRLHVPRLAQSTTLRCAAGRPTDA